MDRITPSERRQSITKQLKVLEDARVDMVTRHEKPAVIHAVSAQIRQLRRRLERFDGQ